MPLNTVEDPQFNKQAGDQFRRIVWELVSTKKGCIDSAQQTEPCVSQHVLGTSARNLKHLVLGQLLTDPKHLTQKNLFQTINDWWQAVLVRFVLIALRYLFEPFCQFIQHPEMPWSTLCLVWGRDRNHARVLCHVMTPLNTPKLTHWITDGRETPSAPSQLQKCPTNPGRFMTY